MQAVKGLGVDIVEIDRMEGVLARHPRIRQRVFTEEEQAYCEGKTNPAIHYALRFAAKEAAAKALGTGVRGLRWRDLEVCRDGKGKPSLELHGAAARLAGELGVNAVYLSLSFTRRNAVASVIAVGSE